MTTVDVSGTMLRGAVARESGQTLADNPYASAPGTYTLHKAWRYGFEHAAEVQAETLGDEPADSAYDDLRERRV